MLEDKKGLGNKDFDKKEEFKAKKADKDLLLSKTEKPRGDGEDTPAQVEGRETRKGKKPRQPDKKPRMPIRRRGHSPDDTPPVAGQGNNEPYRG